MITTKQIRSKMKFNKTEPKKKKIRKSQSSLKSISYNNWAYQHVGLILKPYITSSQYGYCNKIINGF